MIQCEAMHCLTACNQDFSIPKHIIQLQSQRHNPSPHKTYDAKTLTQTSDMTGIPTREHC